MGKQRIELVFFEGCPNVGLARDNLRSALQSAGDAGAFRGYQLDGVGPWFGLDPEGFTMARVAYRAHRRP